MQISPSDNTLGASLLSRANNPQIARREVPSSDKGLVQARSVTQNSITSQPARPSQSLAIQAQPFRPNFGDTNGGATPAPATSTNPILGDVDGDGELSFADGKALLGMLFSGQGGSFSRSNDVNGDGSLNIADVINLFDQLRGKSAYNP